MRRIQRPPRLRTDSQLSSAAVILPKCIRPVGDGANRPTGTGRVLFSFSTFIGYSISR